MTTKTAPKVGETTNDLSFLGRRDAFHVPGILAQSDETLYEGASVAFTDSSLTKVRIVNENKRHGIVDPFMDKYVSSGSLVWILLKPGTVNNLVHSFEVDIEIPTPKDEESDSSSCYTCYGYESEEEYEESGCKGCYE